MYTHAGAVASIKFAAVNKPANPHKIRDCGLFLDYNF
jgi:hypothetical protein